jgi:hypothetical protein
MLFIIMQQVQPAICMQLMLSQQAWIMLQQFLSPLVQVMQQPSAVISHLHMPIIRLQQNIVMPFIMQQQLHIPPAIIVHRFWSMPRDVSSSHMQLIFMPPAHFSNFIVQRGTIIMFMPMGIPPVAGIVPADMRPIPMSDMPIIPRSIIIRVIFAAPAPIRPPMYISRSCRQPFACTSLSTR